MFEIIVIGVGSLFLPFLILYGFLEHKRRQIPTQGGERKIYKVSERVYFYRGFFSNSVVFLFDSCAVVIDTQTSTWGGEHFRKAIESVTDKPIRYVINTHYHGDHVGGNAAFLHTEIIMSKESARMAVERDDERVQYADVFGLLFQEVPPIAQAHITFEDSLVLEIDGEELHILHCGKIETEDACIVWWPSQGALACGDGVTTSGYPFLGVPFLDEGLRYDGEWIKFFQNIIDLKPNLLLPGHGPIIEGEQKIADRLRLLQKVLSDVLECTKKYLEPHMTELRSRWQSGTLPSGNIPRKIVEDVFDKLTEEIGHYPKTPELEEHVSCQRFAYYRAINSYIDERKGRGWWEDIRPSVHPDIDITPKKYHSLRYSQILIEVNQALKVKDLKTALEYAEAYRVENPTDPDIWALQSDIYIRGVGMLTSRIDGSEFLKLATSKAKKSLTLQKEQPLALLNLAFCQIFSDLIIGQSSEESIEMLKIALASSMLNKEQEMRGRMMLGKAYQYTFQDSKADEQYRLLLPSILRLIYPMFRPLMWALK